MSPRMLGLSLLSLRTRDWRKPARRILASPGLPVRLLTILARSSNHFWTTALLLTSTVIFHHRPIPIKARFSFNFTSLRTTWRAFGLNVITRSRSRCLASTITAFSCIAKLLECSQCSPCFHTQKQSVFCPKSQLMSMAVMNTPSRQPVLCNGRHLSVRKLIAGRNA